MEIKRKNLELYNRPEYRRSRTAYCIECAFAYFVTLHTSGTFLAAFLSYMGLSDAMVGILSSILSLSGIFQLLTLLVMSWVRNTKRYVILMQTGSNLLLVSLYLLPFLPVFGVYRQVCIVAGIILAYVGRALVMNVLFRWGNSFVHPRQRGIFSGGKEMLSLILAMPVSLLAALVFDKLQLGGNSDGAYLFLALSGFAFIISDFVCMLLMDNQASSVADTPPLRSVVCQILTNKEFQKVAIVSVLVACSNALMAFQSTYRLKELGYSAGMVLLVTNIGILLRMVLSRPLGKLADRYSYATVIRLSLIFVAASFLLEVISVPGTRFLMIPAVVIYNGAQAGVAGNLENIIYNVTDERLYVQTCAIRSCMTGLSSFVVSLIGGWAIGTVQSNQNMIFGIQIYGQQILMTGATLLVVVAILLLRLPVKGKCSR